MCLQSSYQASPAPQSNEIGAEASLRQVQLLLGLRKMRELQQQAKLQELQQVQEIFTALEVQSVLKLHKIQQGQRLMDLQKMHTIQAQTLRSQDERQARTQLEGKRRADTQMATEVPQTHSEGQRFSRRPITIAAPPGLAPPGLAPPDLCDHAGAPQGRSIVPPFESASCPLTEVQKPLSERAALRRRTLVVARFPKELTEETLAKSFDAIVGCGKVVHCQIIHDSSTKCYAFIEFLDERWRTMLSGLAATLNWFCGTAWVPSGLSQQVGPRRPRELPRRSRTRQSAPTSWQCLKVRASRCEEVRVAEGSHLWKPQLSRRDGSDLGRLSWHAHAAKLAVEFLFG
jgi:hypothetical protein